MAGTLAIIASLATIGGAGTAIGSTIANDVSKPPATPTPTLPQAPTLTPQQIQQASQQTAGAGANTQATTGQGLSPTAQASLLDQLYGTPG